MVENTPDGKNTVIILGPWDHEAPKKPDKWFGGFLVGMIVASLIWISVSRPRGDWKVEI
jgi:hypothetical protein